MTHQLSLQNQNIILKIFQKGNRLFCNDKMTKGNIQYNKINNIYLRGDRDIVTSQLTMLSQGYNIFRHPLKYMLFIYYH